MNTRTAVIFSIVIIFAVAVGMYYFAPLSGPAAGTSPTATTTEQSLHEETDAYSLDATYPSLGIPAFDSAVMSAVARATTEFRSYPALPEDSAVPKNEFTGSYNQLYLGEDIASVVLSFSEYTGGAHPNTAYVGVNVNLKNGKELTLDDALALIDMSLQSVADESRRQLSEKLGDAFFEEGTTATPENYKTFAVGADSVTFIFQNYQAAPYSAGAQSVTFARVR